MIDHDLNCASHGPTGAMCQKIRGHIGDHDDGDIPDDGGIPDDLTDGAA